MPTRQIRPMWTLWLLSAAHAVNHAQAAVLPLVYIAVIDDFKVEPAAIVVPCRGRQRRVRSRPVELQRPHARLLAAVDPVGRRRDLRRRHGRPGARRQLPRFRRLEPPLARRLPRRSTRSATACCPSSSRQSGAASPSRRTSPAATWARSFVPLLGAFLILTLGWRPDGGRLRPAGHRHRHRYLVCWWPRAAPTARRRARTAAVRSAFGAVFRDRDLVLVFVSAAIGGGGRGLGVLNVFVPLYLTFVLHLDPTTVALMYTVLVMGSVPGPIVAGWLSDRLRPQAADHRRLHRRCDIAGPVRARRRQPAAAVALDRADEHLQLRREPAAAGAALRPDAARAARRCVLALTSRSPSALARCGLPCTVSSLTSG